MSADKQLLYCHCAYAKVVPRDVKAEMLRRLGASERAFEAVPDLCAMSARNDPALVDYARREDLEIVACYPRAVRWLFHAGGEDLKDGVRIHNMRTASAEEIGSELGLGAAEAVEEVSS